MPIDFPTTVKPRSSKFALQSNTRVYASPMSQSTQRLEMPGARWKATYEFPPMTRAECAPLISFLTKLRGAASTFYGFDPAARELLGTGAGTPLVNGAGQTGRILISDGWIANQTVLKTGDYFQIGTELKVVTDDVTSDSSGNATISFEPALRSSPANNALITVTNPTCIMRLIDDEQTSWDVDESMFYRIQFSAIEAF